MTKLVDSTGSPKVKASPDLKKINKDEKHISGQNVIFDANILEEMMNEAEEASVDVMKVQDAFKSGQVITEHRERLDLREARSLFLRFGGAGDGPLPTSKEQVQKLHPDIVNVYRNNQIGTFHNSRPTRCVFVEFDSEDICEKAKSKLAATRFGDQEINVDYMGKKSKSWKPEPNLPATNLNKWKLCIRGSLEKMTEEILKTMFPKSDSVEIAENKDVGYITFKSIVDAKMAFDDSDGLKDREGRKLTVVYVDDTIKPKKKKKKKNKKKEN